MCVCVRVRDTDTLFFQVVVSDKYDKAKLNRMQREKLRRYFYTGYARYV